MTHTTYVYIAAAYLAIMGLSLLAYCRRVIKSERVYIYSLDSAKVDTFSLRKIKAAKFSEILKFKFSGLMIKN